MHHEALKKHGRKTIRTGFALALVGVLLGIAASMFQNGVVLFLGLLLLAVGLLFLGVWSGMNYADKTLHDDEVRDAREAK